MKTIKQLKCDMYDKNKDNYNDFLSEGEKYIVDNLMSIDDGLEIETYSKDQAFDIICNSIKSYAFNDSEDACYNMGYVDGYKEALILLQGFFISINIANKSMNKESKTFTSIKLEQMLNNLLIN